MAKISEILEIEKNREAHTMESTDWHHTFAKRVATISIHAIF